MRSVYTRSTPPGARNSFFLKDIPLTRSYLQGIDIPPKLHAEGPRQENSGPAVQKPAGNSPTNFT
jgi:hypothetical protein